MVIVGATNRPSELDEAVRRRFVKRIYIPLPDASSRSQLLMSLLKTIPHTIDDEQVALLTDKTSGFSGADIRALCSEAAMGPMREVAIRSNGNLADIASRDVPPISFDHFQQSLESVMATVSPSDLTSYVDWNNLYGSFRKME